MLPHAFFFHPFSGDDYLVVGIILMFFFFFFAFLFACMDK